MVTALNVANLFLAWAAEDGDSITNLKLQKLLYYAQAWYLVNSRRRLFSDPIEAWSFGPVIRDIYLNWKRYGSKPIPYKPTRQEEHRFTGSQLTFLRECYRIFSNFSATALLSMSHNEDPWKTAFQRGPNTVISPSQMRDYYTRLYETQNGKAQ